MLSNNQLKKLASIFSVSLALSLSILKIFASYYTGSLSILSSLIDSFTDVLASGITFIAIRYSARPASHDFRYGYGKAEALSSFIQSLFITCSGIFILIDGIKRFFSPRPIDDSFLGLSIMGISLVLTICLVCFQSHVIKRTNSLALKGDSAHYVVDIATNISVIAALIAIKITGIYWIDNAVAIGIAIYLLNNAYDLAKEAICTLMDQELDDEIKSDIEKIVLAQSFARGMHDLRTRSLGETLLFEFHLELEPNISLTQAHDYAHDVEEQIWKIYPNSQVIIHQEPVGAKEKRLDHEIEKNG